MRYAVIYQSKSGNTRMLAEEIYEALDTEDKEMVDLDVRAEIPMADVYFVGFGIHNQFCSMNILDAFEQITDGKIALFATCGYLPTEQYQAKLENVFDPWIPDEAEYRGMLLCQGKVAQEQKNEMIGNMPNREKELNKMFKLGSDRPDREDLEAAAAFARKIQAEAE